MRIGDRGKSPGCEYRFDSRIAGRFHVFCIVSDHPSTIRTRTVSAMIEMPADHLRMRFWLLYVVRADGSAAPVRLTRDGADVADPRINNLGVKGLGEPARVPSSGAVANAVFNAIGVHVREIPMTPPRVLAALKRKESRS